MFRRYQNAESIGGFATILMGISIAATTVASGIPLPAGAAQITFGSGTVFGQVKHMRRSEAQTVLNKFKAEITKEWTNWAKLDGNQDEGQTAHIFASFEEAISRISISPSEVTAHRLDPTGIANLMLAKAEEALPNTYSRTGGPDADLARTFLWDLTFRAYGHLLEVPQYMTRIAPALWTDLMGQLDRVEERLDEGLAETSTRLAAIEAMLSDALLNGTQASNARKSGVSDAALVALASKISTDVDGPEQALRELERAVDIAIEVQQNRRATNDIDAINQAAEYAANGDHDQAADKIEDALIAAQNAHLENMLGLLEAGLQHDLLRRAPLAAAQKLMQIADVKSGGLASFDDISKTFLEWYNSGRSSGVILDMSVAGALAELLKTRAKDNIERGSSHNYAGVIAFMRGERESDKALLPKAVEAFEGALAEWPRKSEPELWAKAQMNLANSLHAIAMRKVSNNQIHAAIDAYKRALTVRSKTKAPLEWAQTTTNYATALRTLGEMTHDPKEIRKSIKIFEEAGDIRTKSVGGNQWQVTRINIGKSLLSLGKMTKSRDELLRAIAELNQVVETCDPKDDRYLLATCDQNLGLAQTALAELTGEADRLTQARAHFANALEIFPNDENAIDRLLTMGADAIAELKQVSSGFGRSDPGDARTRLGLAIDGLRNAGHIRAADQMSQDSIGLADNQDHEPSAPQITNSDTA